MTDKDLDMFVWSKKDVFTGGGARLDLASGSGKFGRPGEVSVSKSYVWQASFRPAIDRVHTFNCSQVSLSC